MSETSKWRCIIDSWIYASGNQWKDSDKEYKFDNYSPSVFRGQGDDKETTKETEDE